MAGHQDDISFLLQIGDGGTTDVDVTEHVQSFRPGKGRDRETDLYQPASATLTLLDTDRRFDPNNTTGPYVAGLTPLRRVRAQLDSANVENYMDSDLGPVASPDAAALDVTGNIHVRWFGSLDDWSPASDEGVFSKWSALANQRSWKVQFEATGVRFYISTDGTNEFATTLITVPFVNGGYGGVGFKRVQATGVTTCEFSTDGETWTDHATTTVLSAGTALHNSTEQVLVGGGNDGGFGAYPNGRTLFAELWNGIDGSGGTLAASPTFMTLQSGHHLFFEPFTDAQGNEWTGLGADNVVQAGSRLFTGFVTDWSVDYYDGDRTAIVTVTCTDALGVLANCELDTIADAHSGDTSGVRVQRVLDLAEVAFTDATSIDAGQSTFGATTFGGNALDYLQQCAKAEGGYLFVDRNGTFQFLDRHSLLNDSTATVEFTDAHVGTGILYRRLSQSSSADLLYNRITGVGTSGNEQAESDATSQDMYKVRTLAVGETLLSNDGEVSSLLQWLLQRFKDPEARFSAIELNTMSLSEADAQKVALLDLATLVSVERLPLGVPDDPFLLDGGGYTVESLSLLDLEGGGYEEAA